MLLLLYSLYLSFMLYMIKGTVTGADNNRVICTRDSNDLYISCGGQFIMVTYANWGRTQLGQASNNKACPWRRDPSKHTQVNCTSSSDYIKSKCHGKGSCLLQIKMFISKISGRPNPCPGTYKYLNISWYCGEMKAVSLITTPELQVNSDVTETTFNLPTSNMTTLEYKPDNNNYEGEKASPAVRTMILSVMIVVALSIAVFFAIKYIQIRRQMKVMKQNIDENIDKTVQFGMCVYQEPCELANIERTEKEPEPQLEQCQYEPLEGAAAIYQNANINVYATINQISIN